MLKKFTVGEHVAMTGHDVHGHITKAECFPGDGTDGPQPLFWYTVRIYGYRGSFTASEDELVAYYDKDNFA